MSRQKLGGKARAGKLTPARRSEIAKAAAAARWKSQEPPVVLAGTPPADTHPPKRRGAFIPEGMAELEVFCRKMVLSFALPRRYYDMPYGLPEALLKSIDLMEVATARAMHAVQLGMEVGLPPAQALQSIIVQDGAGRMSGDAQLALVLDSGKALYVREYTTGGEMYIDGQVNKAHAAVCETHRIGAAEPVQGIFSVDAAHDAELWNKAGSWRTHKPRMLKYKARAFCLRDVYPDVLKGLSHSVEEMEGESLAGGRAPATDISPRQGAEKLAGLLDKRALNNTVTILHEVENE